MLWKREGRINAPGGPRQLGCGRTAERGFHRLRRSTGLVANHAGNVVVVPAVEVRRALLRGHRLHLRQRPRVFTPWTMPSRAAVAHIFPLRSGPPHARMHTPTSHQSPARLPRQDSKRLQNHCVVHTLLVRFHNPIGPQTAAWHTGIPGGGIPAGGISAGGGPDGPSASPSRMRFGGMPDGRSDGGGILEVAARRPPKPIRLLQAALDANLN